MGHMTNLENSSDGNYEITANTSKSKEEGLGLGLWHLASFSTIFQLSNYQTITTTSAHEELGGWIVTLGQYLTFVADAMHLLIFETYKSYL